MALECTLHFSFPLPTPVSSPLFLVTLTSIICVFQDPAGIFELIEVVGTGTYGQVHKVRQGAGQNGSGVGAIEWNFMIKRAEFMSTSSPLSGILSTKAKYGRRKFVRNLGTKVGEKN